MNGFNRKPSHIKAKQDAFIYLNSDQRMRVLKPHKRHMPSCLPPCGTRRPPPRPPATQRRRRPPARRAITAISPPPPPRHHHPTTLPHHFTTAATAALERTRSNAPAELVHDVGRTATVLVVVDAAVAAVVVPENGRLAKRVRARHGATIQW